LNLGTDTETTTFNLTTTDNISAKTIRTHNLVFVFVYNDIFSPTSYTLTMTGRVWDSDHGYVDVLTVTPFVFSSISQLFPDSGQIILTGAGNASIRVTALSSTLLTVELDLDGDSVYELAVPLKWTDLNGPIGADLGDDDGDGMHNSWEAFYGLNPSDPADAGLDNDGDGFTNAQEYQGSTDPNNGSSFPPSADLSITMTDSLDPVPASTTFNYLLAVRNAGPLVADNVRVEDALPAGMSFISASGNGWNCGHASGTVTCTRPSLSVSAASDITLAVAAPSGLGSVSNTASVSSDTPDLNDNNNAASEATDVVPAFLSFVEFHEEGTGALQDLSGAGGVAVSPDGAHVYVAGLRQDTVAVFSRSPSTGMLSLVEMQKDFTTASRGLNPVSSIAISPDGTHLYVIPGQFNALAVFNRNAITGALALVEVHEDNVAGVDGLDFARSVVVSPDGAHVYVVGTFDNAIAVFTRNPITGMLSFVEVQKDDVAGVDGLDNPTDVAISLDGAHVYVSGNTQLSQDAGSVAVFSRNATTGALTFVEVQERGVNGVDGIDRPSGVTVSADGAHVYVTSPFDEAVAVFGRNPSTGALTFVQAQRDGISVTETFDPARSPVVSPDGANVFVEIGRIEGSAISVFKRDPATGTLIFQEMQTDGVSGVELRGGQITVSPDGANLYAAGGDLFGAPGAITVFKATPTLPTVARVDSVANTGDFQIRENEETNAVITQLLITFGKSMNDAAGDTGPDDITNPANYRLFTDGVDGVFDSPVCGAAQGDDGSIAIDSVTYDAATRTAMLNINASVALGPDAYRLFVCGANIKDTERNQLDGNADGVGGDDFVRNFIVL
jgi:uncharacterized repeat protein (TIGR01451 family)